jgi:hypothetical protein
VHSEFTTIYDDDGKGNLARERVAMMMMMTTANANPARLTMIMTTVMVTTMTTTSTK